MCRRSCRYVDPICSQAQRELVAGLAYDLPALVGWENRQQDIPNPAQVQHPGRKTVGVIAVVLNVQAGRCLDAVDSINHAEFRVQALFDRREWGNQRAGRQDACLVGIRVERGERLRSLEKIPRRDKRIVRLQQHGGEGGEIKNRQTDQADRRGRPRKLPPRGPPDDAASAQEQRDWQPRPHGEPGRQRGSIDQNDFNSDQRRQRRRRDLQRARPASRRRGAEDVIE